MIDSAICAQTAIATNHDEAWSNSNAVDNRGRPAEFDSKPWLG
jgi:hypothetical protein